jgi:hypothetical protein
MYYRENMTGPELGFYPTTGWWKSKYKNSKSSRGRKRDCANGKN